MAPEAIDTSPSGATPFAAPQSRGMIPNVNKTAPCLAQKALDAAIARFEARNPISKQLHERATTSMPGGNTRTQLHTSPFPVVMKHGRGYQVTSEDGCT